MGKYYKTAKPTFVDDAMYEAPYELMAKALAAKDADFKENEEALAELGDVGDLLKYMNADEAKRNEIIKTFGDTSTSLSEAINKSPALADAYAADIRKAQRAWKDEITSGTLRKIHRNEEQKTKLFEDIDKRQGVSEESKRLAQAVAMKDYQDQGGVEGGNFTEDMNIYKELDETKYVQHLKSVINENGNNYSNEAQGEDDFIVKTGGSSRYIRRGRIEEIIDSDPATKDWKNEKMQQLEYKARLGEIDKEDIEEIYQKDYADFKENTVKKLEYEITGSVRGLKADPTGTRGSGRNKEGYGGEAAIDLPVKKVNFNSILTAEKNEKGEFKSPYIRGMFRDKNKKLPGQKGYDEASGQAAFQKAAVQWDKDLTTAGLKYKDVADVFREAEKADDKGKAFSESLDSLRAKIKKETGKNYSKTEMAGFLNAGQTHNFHLDPLVNAGDAMPLKQQIKESRSIISAVANLPVGTDVTYFAYDEKNNMIGSGKSTLDELEKGQYISPPVDEAYTKTPYSEQGYLAQKNGDYLTTENPDDPAGERIKYGTSPQEIQNYKEAKAIELGVSPSEVTVEMDATKTSKESVARNYFAHLMQGKMATNVYKGHRYDYGNGYTKPKKNHFYYIKKEYLKKDDSRGTILIGVPQNSLGLTTGKYIK